MLRRTMLTGAAALAVAPALAQQASSRTRVTFWHSMTGALAEQVNRLVAQFNGGQSAVEVAAVFKGTYAETLAAAIAAWRAGQAPDLVQMFEVGTGSMLAAGPATKQVWELAKETGVALDPEAYIGAVRGYYSLTDGRLASCPFNSSTAVLWVNEDALEQAGLDPKTSLATWDEVSKACQAIKAKSATGGQATPMIPLTSTWFTWIQLEQFAAIHDVPYATKENGFAGMDAELLINQPPFVRHLTRVLDLGKQDLLKYVGRDSAGEQLFYAGQSALSFNSSGFRGDVAKNAKFKWREALLPYDPQIKADPINSIIGGASLWVMTAPNRKAEDYKGAAQFLAFLAQPEQAARWSEATGYVPVTTAGYEFLKKEGFYDKNPGSETPVEQLRRGQVTPNSKGFRLGRMAELRTIQYEEIERAFQGQQTAQQALDSAVTRGNRVLRDFERANKA